MTKSERKRDKERRQKMVMKAAFTAMFLLSLHFCSTRLYAKAEAQILNSSEKDTKPDDVAKYGKCIAMV